MTAWVLILMFLFIEQIIDRVGMILDKQGFRFVVVGRGALAITTIDWVVGDHGRSASVVIIWTIELVGEAHKDKEGKRSHDETQKEDYIREHSCRWVLRNKVIGQHLNEQGQKARETMHDCQAEARWDWEDQLCYELVDKQSQWTCDDTKSYDAENIEACRINDECDNTKEYGAHKDGNLDQKW